MRLGGWKLPVERLSATSIGTYLMCPESFRQKYILKQPEALSGEKFIGGITHEALRMLYTYKETDPATLVGKAWQERIETEGEPDWHDMDAVEAFRRSNQMIKAYIPYAAKTKPVAVEQRFEETIRGVPVIGYIDLEMEDRIREVKTSSKRENKPKSRWRLQGRLYSLVSSKPVEWHCVTRQVTPQVVTPDDAPDLFQTFNPDVTNRMFQFAVERMNDDYARYGGDSVWPLDGANHDWACSYCSFKKGCFAWQ